MSPITDAMKASKPSRPSTDLRVHSHRALPVLEVDTAPGILRQAGGPGLVHRLVTGGHLSVQQSRSSAVPPPYGLRWAGDEVHRRSRSSPEPRASASGRSSTAVLAR